MYEDVGAFEYLVALVFVVGFGSWFLYCLITCTWEYLFVRPKEKKQRQLELEQWLGRKL